MHERDAEARSTRPSAAAAKTANKETSPGIRSARLMNLQRDAGNSSVAALFQRQSDGEEEESSPVKELMRSGGGQPIDKPVRQFMETRLGADFSDVRIHTGARATEAARSVQAHAYTLGTDVVFQDGHYNPSTTDGQKMLAHELTHVVQQKAGPVDGTPAPGGISISDPSDRFERAADASAENVMTAGPVSTTHAVDGLGLQRQEEEEEELQMKSVQRQDEEEELANDQA